MINQIIGVALLCATALSAAVVEVTGEPFVPNIFVLNQCQSYRTLFGAQSELQLVPNSVKQRALIGDLQWNAYKISNVDATVNGQYVLLGKNQAILGNGAIVFRNFGSQKEYLYIKNADKAGHVFSLGWPIVVSHDEPNTDAFKCNLIGPEVSEPAEEPTPSEVMQTEPAVPNDTMPNVAEESPSADAPHEVRPQDEAMHHPLDRNCMCTIS